MLQSYCKIYLNINIKVVLHDDESSGKPHKGELDSRLLVGDAQQQLVSLSLSTNQVLPGLWWAFKILSHYCI